MTYDEIHPTLRAAMGTFEGFRKVNFSAEDIFVELAGNHECGPNELMVFVLLRTQGKEFRVGVGRWPAGQEDRLQAEWSALCAAMNSRQVSQADMDRMWQESLPYKDRVGFVTAILDKGIAVPGHEELMASLRSTQPTDMPSEFSVPCEFCAGTVTSMQDPQAQRGTAIAHSNPPCKKFRKLDSLSFMRAMNASLRKRKAKEASDPVPTSPREGDVCIGCVHRPNPTAGCHFFWLGSSGMMFQRPGGTMGRARWLLLCTGCFTENADQISENLRSGRVKVGCDMMWPKGLRVNPQKKN
jgi:hypothetical protein